MIHLTREEVLGRRLRATCLDERLPSGSYARGAYGGLQDTAPRAAQMSLHARVASATPTAWEDPSLVQIWFRGADYVVPRDAVGVFTVGASPRDRDRMATLEAVADAVHGVLQGATMKARDVYEALPQYERGMFVRVATITGRLHLRWDASMIWLIPAERPEVDVEDARTELARRFVRWFGPATVERFAWWAALEPEDAKLTWSALEQELVPVSFAGEERFMFAGDDPAEEITGVRLIPPDDPFLKFDRGLITTDPDVSSLLFPKRSPGYIPGGLLVDGDIAGVWQRQRRRVTIHTTRAIDRNRVEMEALSLPIPDGSTPEVRWA